MAGAPYRGQPTFKFGAVPAAGGGRGSPFEEKIKSHALASYVSEPPSSLIAMARMAEDEAAREQALLDSVGSAGSGPHSALRARAASDHGQERPRALHANVKGGIRSTLVWFQARDANRYQERVLEHPLAGDLAVASAAEAAAVGKRSWRTSAAPSPRHSPLKARGEDLDCSGSDGSSSTGSEEEDPLENDLDWTTRSEKVPWYKRRNFWRYGVPCMISVGLIVAGTLYVCVGTTDVWGNVQVWRLLYFLAGLPFIWYFGDLVTWAAVWGVEKSLFTWKNALYFAYAVRYPLANVLRAALGLAWWAAMMKIGVGEQARGLNDVFSIILKLWACVTLFMTANLLKTLIAKLLSSKFVRDSHTRKMHDSLKKEYLLHMLLQPRQSYIRAAKEFEVEGPDSWDAEGGEAGIAGSKKRRNMSFWQRGLEAVGDMRSKLAAPSQKGEPGTPTMEPSSSTVSHDPENPKTPRSGAAARAGPEPTPRPSRWTGLFRRTARPRPPLPVSASAASGSVRAGSRPTKGVTADSEPSTPRMGGATPRAAHAVARASRPAGAPTVSAAPTLRVLPRGSVAGRASAATSQGRTPRRGSGTPRTAAGTPRAPASAGTHASPARRPLQRESDLDRVSRLLGEDRPPLERVSRRAAAERNTAAAARAAVTYAKPLVQGEGGRPGGSASSASFQPQQAMRLAQMERYIRKNALQVTFRDTLSRAERREVVTTEQEAKKLAFYLFWNVKADYARSTLNAEDLGAFLGPADAQQAFELLDADGDGSITAQDVCQAILDVFRERQNLAASLIDTKSVVASLENMIAVVLHIVMAFLYLVIFGVNVLNFYLTFSSMILAFSFVFSNSLKLNYENAVFLFVVHPYDVGDHLLIDNETCRVDAISLTYTTLTTPTNRQLWYPNEKIRATTFVNLTNSGNAARSLAISLDVDTPAHIPLALLEAAKEVAAQQPKEFDGEPGIVYGAAPEPMRYVLTVYWTLSHPGADLGRAGRVQSAMINAILSRLAQLGARCSAPPLRAPGVDQPDYFTVHKVEEPSTEAAAPPPPPAEAARQRVVAGLAAALETPVRERRAARRRATDGA